MIETVSLTRGTTYAPPPMKFEAGTANFIGIAGLGAAVEFVNGLDTNAIEAYEKKITEKAIESLQKIEGCRIYGIPGTYYGQVYEKIPVFSMSIEGAHPSDIAMLLDKRDCRPFRHAREPLLNVFSRHPYSGHRSHCTTRSRT